MSDSNRIFKVVWSIVADGTLFKGAYAILADDESHAIERVRAVLGKEGGAASIYVKDAGQWAIEMGRREYPADGSKATAIPHISSQLLGAPAERFVFDVAARANVIATDEEDATKKFGHSISGKEVHSVKFLRIKCTDPEPLSEMSSYEKHLLEKQFRSVRVAST
jgi:hypothetical protein